MNTNQANVMVLTDANGVKREYTEVKRKANVGERVKVVLSDNGMMPRKGDVLKIVIANEYDDLVDGEVPSSCMRPENYVALEPTSIVIIDGVRYREEKRKAAVGERILMTRDCSLGDFYKGQVFTATGDGSFIDNRGDARYYGEVSGNPYVVLTLIEELATQQNEVAPKSITVTIPAIHVTVASMDEIEQAVADAVKAELVKVNRKSADELFMTAAKSLAEVTAQPKPKTPQELRDEIVERAKADVAELERIGKSLDARLDGSARFYNWFYRVEFVVNCDKRTVVALVRPKYNELIKARGIAKCTPGDVFNVHLGKIIALRRALGLEVPAEYTNAPQPTEVRVGDVVETYGYDRTHHATFTVTGFDDGDTRKLKGFSNHGGYTSFDRHLGDKVIDDSRENDVAQAEVSA
ncbi:hypothetical protein [Brevibacillus porteri]|uniref:hypothetical protein n=1 Tax=Brevibacillus porteri TaxID=2126350 RepID=UPI003D20F9D1